MGAVDVGLGACWVSSFETYKIRELLHIPEGIEPEILIAVGYPDETPGMKRIRPVETMAFFNEYGVSNNDASLHKRDYGEFVRDRLDTLKTRAAYETAPRGGVRMAVERARARMKELFAKKPKKQPAPTAQVQTKQDAADREKASAESTDVLADDSTEQK
jgi:hypothetical protein